MGCHYFTFAIHFSGADQLAFFIALTLVLRFMLMKRNSTRRKAQEAAEGQATEGVSFTTAYAYGARTLS